MKTQIQSRGLIGYKFSLALIIIILLGTQWSPAKSAEPMTITIVPDQITLNGDVATKANTAGRCTESWLSAMPDGSIILGVDPNDCNPAAWDGASASANIFLPNDYPSTLYVLELSWPDHDGKGLHSPLKNQMASILFDSHSVWNKKTTDISDFGDYYGAQHESIKTTIVVTQSGTHTLTISLPPRTAWDLSKIELKAYPMPLKIQGIGYSPYRDCQTPGGAIQPSTQNIQEDLTRLFHASNAIRTYSSTGVNGQIPALANSLGLPIFAGAWLDNNTNDAAEIQGLIDLTKSYSLDGVIVGNEFYLRHRSEADIEYLRQKIVQVKNAIPSSIPVTTAEIDDLMFNWSTGTPTINPVYRPILDQVDIVMVHIYPFWAGLPIEGAADYTIAHYKAIQTLIEQVYPGQHKRVIIGEAGWPSAGGAQTQAVPSLQNQRRYLLEFLTRAEQQGVEYFYFDGFDELWKIEEPGHVGQSWGFSYLDRSAKHGFYGTLLPSDQLAYYNTFSPLSKIPDIDLVAKSKRTFSIYTEWPEEPGHFTPSGWMGDAEVPGRVSFTDCYLDGPYNGITAIRINYQYGSLGWAGMYWVNPADNWGNLPGGIDLRGASRLTFWARTDTPGAQVEFIIGGVGYKVDAAGNALCNQPIYSYPDSVCPKIEQTETLNTTWTKYSIDLSTSTRDLSRVVGGFGWVSTNPLIFYLDDIVYEFDQSSFSDVPPSHWAYSYIERLYNAGITGGCIANPLQYCPEASVTRAQMAVFLLKGVHGSGYTPPAVGTSTGFNDVSTNYWAAAWIKQLAVEGITGGCGSGNYCPDATVTRAQMAVFLLKAKHGISYSPPAATGVFTDVPVGYWADKWIEQLASEGITGGCGTGIYCPDSDVTRAQMAVFLVKTFNLP